MAVVNVDRRWLSVVGGGWAVVLGGRRWLAVVGSWLDGGWRLGDPGGWRWVAGGWLVVGSGYCLLIDDGWRRLVLGGGALVISGSGLLAIGCVTWWLAVVGRRLAEVAGMLLVVAGGCLCMVWRLVGGWLAHG